MAGFGSRANQVKRMVLTCLQNAFFFFLILICGGGGGGAADRQTPFVCAYGLTPVQKKMEAAPTKCLLLTRSQEDAQYVRAYT